MIAKYSLHHYYHEAGHVVVAYLLPQMNLLKITPECTFFTANRSKTQLIMTYLAGIVVEEILFNEKLGPQYDLAIVKKLKTDYREEKKLVEEMILTNMVSVLKIGRLLMQGPLSVGYVEAILNNI